jgi:hypothetical protein
VRSLTAPAALNERGYMAASIQKQITLTLEPIAVTA